jgi:flagellar basal body rod protein FlgF
VNSLQTQKGHEQIDEHKQCSYQSKKFMGHNLPIIVVQNAICKFVWNKHEWHSSIFIV